VRPKFKGNLHRNNVANYSFNLYSIYSVGVQRPDDNICVRWCPKLGFIWKPWNETSSL